MEGDVASSPSSSSSPPSSVSSGSSHQEGKLSKEPTLNESSEGLLQLVVENNIEKNIDCFKQFAVVQYSLQGENGHYYGNPVCHIGGSFGDTNLPNKPHIHEPLTTKDWVKRIQKEWELLEKDLPDSIFVRVYEDRMDLLRAVIIGSSGTPYQDGLFFFDVHFPAMYPDVPPAVHYHSHGYRLNPNLYECGYVCLSLLGTWDGTGCERWKPDNSTMLQVLVSLQGLVLNEKPYYNEPGFDHHPEESSVFYNNNVLFLSFKTMIHTIRNPPKHFEDFVFSHFQRRGEDILVFLGEWIAHGYFVNGNDDDEGKANETASSFNSKLVLEFESLKGYINSIQKHGRLPTKQEATPLDGPDVKPLD